MRETTRRTYGESKRRRMLTWEFIDVQNRILNGCPAVDSVRYIMGLNYCGRFIQLLAQVIAAGN